ncbi:MAG: glycosyltransferase family 4 protein [Lachnospiraceae bacterium]
MKYKILYLMEFPIDLPGGGQMSTQTLCEGLSQTEFEPVAVCPRLLTKTQADFPFRVVEYTSDHNRERSKFRRIFNFFRRIGSFYRIIHSEKPQLIHVSMSESLITFGFLRCIGLFSGIPFVYTDRGLFYGYRSHSRTCIMRTLKHASGMICTTQYNKNLWKAAGVPCKVTVIPNTIGKVFDEFQEGKREEQRKKYGISKEDFVVGFAGRISEEKDWPFVQTLVSALRSSGLRFKVALVLSVYEAQDARLAEDIKNGIIKNIGEENLIYMQDLSQAEIADYYYLVDVFVMTSMFESFGKAAVEAMSRKCAVVSTNVGGLTEVIGKEENLYTKENLQKFTARMHVLFDDRAELDCNREFFYRRYLDHYTKEVHIERHCSLYSGLLES